MTNPDPDIHHEAIIVTTEQGIVMTGSKVDAFEARIQRVVRRPLLLLFVAVAITWMMLAGLSTVVSHLDNTLDEIKVTANESKAILDQATGPDAQAAQQKTVKELLEGVDCRDQANLQKVVDELNRQGLIEAIPILQEACKQLVQNGE